MIMLNCHDLIFMYELALPPPLFIKSPPKKKGLNILNGDNAVFTEYVKACSKTRCNVYHKILTGTAK